MSKKLGKVIGYFAFHPPIDVLCDGDACIIAGTQSALNKYIKTLSAPEVAFQNRKTRLSDIRDGIDRGGAYAFDKESYKIFHPLANELGFKLKNEDFNSTETGLHFVVVRNEIT